MIGGASLVRRGIMPNYTDWSGSMRYFQKRKRYCEYAVSPAIMKIFDEKMENMLKNGVIMEAPYEELIWINPCHLVPKVNGDMRLVMDMTKVNKFMKPITFKMEGISTLSNLLVKNDYAISFDLKEAYNHIPVHPSMQQLLGLAWKDKCYNDNESVRAYNKGSVERENGSVSGRPPSPSPGSRTIRKYRTGGVAISPVAGLDSQRGEVTP
jgi:hypothetical protein